MEVQPLSSNWKKLQETFESFATPKKRKASSALSVRRPTPKRVKTSMMGYLLSKPESTPTVNEANKAATISLAKSASATSLPQPLTDLTIHHPADKINAGITSGINPGKYIAIDCEMVGVGPRPDDESALARVSLVDFNGVQLYDSFVLPKEPVTDFRTFVSGITPKLLKEARALEEVQKDVAALLEGRILVGHAVRHDLDAMMLGHPRRDIRDTSRHPGFRQYAGGRTPGLRKLAKIVLGVEIQAGEHSSVEDARATMALFRKEKNAFEVDHRKRYGHVKTERLASTNGNVNSPQLVAGESASQTTAKSSNARNKRKRKKGKN